MRFRDLFGTRDARGRRRRFPVNKFRSGKVPEVRNPLIIGGIGASILAASTALKFLHNPDVAADDLARHLAQELEGRHGFVSVSAQVRRGFGKPALAQVTLKVQDMAPHPTGQQAPEALCALLDEVARTVWNWGTPAPISISVQAQVGEHPDSEWDLRSAGFSDATARPAELYERYGAPAADPTWRP
ncbi:hypothetical protein [Gleimia hominis]|uniref:hypothetical protein n=1 Tax=Gleimia hominis TaxID=595468 RepID=UPI000C80AD0D|nr:hypothetical protein [Gleimia hominis]WIK64076.1 hypothetical protein CJ187_007155 [Gleimia hominis]